MVTGRNSLVHQVERFDFIWQWHTVCFIFISLNVIESRALRGISLHTNLDSFILVWSPYLTYSYFLSLILQQPILSWPIWRETIWRNFESAVFQTMLQGTITLNGSLFIDSSTCYIKHIVLSNILVILTLFINLFCFSFYWVRSFWMRLCNLAWLIRDNRNLLLPVVHGAQCSNSTRFE